VTYFNFRTVGVKNMGGANLWGAGVWVETALTPLSLVQALKQWAVDLRGLEGPAREIRM